MTDAEQPPSGIGVIVALEDELKALVRGVGASRVHQDEADWRFELGQTTWWVRVSGVGRHCAKQAAERLILWRKVSHMLVVGYAGGLAPGLNPGDLIEATEVREPNGTVFPCASWSDDIRLSGLMVTHHTIAADPDCKADLHHTTGAMCVDMESAGVAEAAKEANDLPFSAVRVILDRYDQELPVGLDSGITHWTWQNKLNLIINWLSKPQNFPLALELKRSRDLANDALSQWMKHQQ